MHSSAGACASASRTRRRARCLRRFRARRHANRARFERVAGRTWRGIGGVCWVLALAMFNVTVQLSTPRWVLGRGLALYQAAAFGGMAAGSCVWGLVAEGYDTRTALTSAAVLLLAEPLSGCAFRSLQVRPTIWNRSTASRCRTSPSTYAGEAVQLPC